MLVKFSCAQRGKERGGKGGREGERDSLVTDEIVVSHQLLHVPIQVKILELIVLLSVVDQSYVLDLGEEGQRREERGGRREEGGGRREEEVTSLQCITALKMGPHILR